MCPSAFRVEKDSGNCPSAASETQLSVVPRKGIVSDSLGPQGQLSPPPTDPGQPPTQIEPGPGLDLRSSQTQLLPELCPQLQGCGERREEAWPSSSLVELPSAVVRTFPLGIRAPAKFELHFRGLRETDTSLRTRRRRLRQPGNGRGVASELVPVEPDGALERGPGASTVSHLLRELVMLSLSSKDCMDHLRGLVPVKPHFSKQNL